MVIQIDTREKPDVIKNIIAEFDKQGIKYFRSKLHVGDYTSLDNPRLAIDRKHNLAELCANTSDVPKKDSQGHFKRYPNRELETELKRFTNEIKRANDFGIKLVILCEHGGKIKTLEDVANWVNPRLKESPLAVSGERLYKKLYMISKNYGVDFVFCDKRNTGKKIIELLGDK